MLLEFADLLGEGLDLGYHASVYLTTVGDVVTDSVLEVVASAGHLNEDLILLNEQFAHRHLAFRPYTGFRNTMCAYTAPRITEVVIHSP